MFANTVVSLRPRVARLVVAFAVVLVATIGSLAVVNRAEAIPAPNSIGAIGDSITVAFNGGEFPPCIPYIDCPRYSFSTGWANPVSHYSRLLELNPNIEGNAYNFARDGSKADDMLGQAQRAVDTGVEYVTLEIGGNDACTRTEGGMTSVETYRDHIQQTLELLTGNGIRVFVLSVPRVNLLHELFWQNPTARFIWSIGSVCQSLLQRPTSFAQADVERRERVEQRVLEYNVQLEEACGSVGKYCKFDDNLIHDFPVPPEFVSPWDYFHPSYEGQLGLTLSYLVGFEWEPV